MEKTNKNSILSINEFVQKVDTVRLRADALQQSVKASSRQQLDVTPAALEELSTALEELHIAEEELKVQNDELIVVRAAIEAERQRYQDLFQFAPDAYLVTDLAGKIQEANRVAVELLKVPQQHLIGKPLVNYIPQEERRSFRNRLNQLHQSNLMQEWELRISPRNGVAFDTAITVSTARNLAGKPEGYRWLLRDITARKQAEAQMRDIQLQNLQLQEAAKLKAHFLAVMSHELRSPMNAIIGFSQILLRHPHHRLAASQANMVERIFNSGKHLLTLIDDILDFSKLEAEGLKLNLEELNLVELVIATVAEMHSLAEQKGIELQTHLDLKNPCIINDATRMRQIVINLVSNALKFTDIGTVQVEAWELPPNQIVIAVRDTGVGIAEEDIKHIFKEFRQLNQTLSRKHGGTGLGLAITERLVQMMRGKIKVESQLGQGTTFYVHLPRSVRAVTLAD